MFDEIYRALDGGTRALVDSKRVRRCAIVLCLAIPFALIHWHLPWFLDAYWTFGAPLLATGVVLVIIDMHFWEIEREEAAKAKAKLKSDETANPG